VIADLDRIHDGGLTSGLGSDPTWYGGNLASRGVIVVVTINYRYVEPSHELE